MKSVHFTVIGEPKAKGRPRFARSGHAYTPKDTIVYENLVRISYMNACGEFRFPDDAPLMLEMDCFYPIPKSATKKAKAEMETEHVYRTKKSDLDNVIKGIQDGVNGVAYRDDNQICEIHARKFYGVNPRVEVTITQLS